MKTMKEYLSTPEGVKQMWKKINEVLDNFDFNTVKVVMDALDWHWACSPDEAEMYEEQGCRARTRVDSKEAYFYPEYPQLLQHARERLVGCIESMPDDETRWSENGGGFKVEVSICTDEERKDYYGSSVADVDDFEHSVDIALYFIVEESTSY